MEWIDGETLAGLIPPAGLEPDEVAEIAEQLAAALAAAHRRGIIHRDLKPANLMLDGDGRLKVLDFGIAKTSPAAGAGEGTA